MARAVRTGHAGTVEHQRDRLINQPHIHEQLVERPVQKRRVHRDNRVQAAERHTGGGSDSVLLRNTDIEETVRELLRKRLQAGRPRHRRGDGHDIVALVAGAQQLLGEHRRPSRFRRGERLPCHRVDDTRGVHLIRHIVHGRGEPVALFSDHVHDQRPLIALGVFESVEQAFNVVAFNRADVLHPQLREHLGGQHLVLHAFFERVQCVERALAHPSHGLQRLLAGLHHFVVRRLHSKRRKLVAKLCQVVGEPADGRRVGPAVVVDHDDNVAVGRRNVVQRLPAHAAGQRTVSYNGNDVGVIAALQRLCLGKAVRVGQRRARVRGLGPIVLRLRTRRVSGKPALFTQRVKLPAASGKDLVHVRLVGGVPNNRVVRRIEDVVQCNGHLHHTQVGAEVPAGGGDLLDQHLADLIRQTFKLRRRKLADIRWRRNVLEQCHSPVVLLRHIGRAREWAQLPFRSR